MPERSEFVEIEPRLESISDTEILLNFAAALETLYPRMRAVFAHFYDPYDAIVEPLYQSLVYSSFSAKYGIAATVERCHRYEMHLTSYALLHHVRLTPREFPLEVCLEHGQHISMSEEELGGRDLVFLHFGDKIHSLTGAEAEIDADAVAFHSTCFTFVEAASGASMNDRWLWVANSDVTYRFVKAGDRTGAE
jgi:hypothetical protein